jgi:hypothetical protein
MLETGLVFLLGVVAAPFAKPILTNIGRPLAREVIKVGMATGTTVHRIVQEVREDIEDLTAEASQELHTDETKKDSKTRSGK